MQIELEILALIARRPAWYRKLRKERFKARYENIISSNKYVYEAFLLLFNEINFEEASILGRIQYENALESARQNP